MTTQKYCWLIISIVLLALIAPNFVCAQRAKAKFVELEIGGALPDVKPMFSLFGPQSDSSFYDLAQRIAKIRKDRAISGVVVKINGLMTGWAKMQELRDMLVELRHSGKEIICFLESGGNVEYLLACAGDKIVMVPSGTLMITGLRAEAIFLKSLLEKLNIEANMQQIGVYKSAAESYTRESMSVAQKEELNLILDDLYVQMVNIIAADRKLKKSMVYALIDNGPFTAKDAKNTGLVDELLYYDQVIELLKQEKGENTAFITGYGQKAKSDPDLSSLGGLLKFFSILSPRPKARTANKPKIALIYASGVILPGAGFDDPFTSEQTITPKTMSKAFQTARDDKSIKAVVFRIDSPGGSAMASDLIWHEVALTQKQKPVVVSMSDVAGSGGYYIAMAADTIVAEPGTITGSIGVIGGKFNFQGLYNKFGITKDVITRGRNANLFSDYSNFTESERARIQKLMEAVYIDFVHKAAEGRNMTDAEIHALAQGRIWTGKQAKELGLIDELGGLDRALSIARKKAHLPAKADDILILPKRKTLFEYLMGNEFDAEISALKSYDTLQIMYGLSIPRNAVAIADLVLIRLFSQEPIATMLPCRIFIR